MAGPNPTGLDDSFPTGIRTAMQLGTPTAPARRPVFVLPVSPNVGEDSRGLPWAVTGDMNDAPSEVSNVLCAVEFKPPGTNLTDSGGVTAQVGVLIVTVLQAEWDQIKTAVAVRTSGITYDRWFDAPDLALGTYGVYQLYFKAGDLS